jgi:hypothetical protein
MMLMGNIFRDAMEIIADGQKGYMPASHTQTVFSITHSDYPRIQSESGAIAVSEIPAFLFTMSRRA